MKRRHTSINTDNYELWFIDYLDGQLSAEENDLLQKFLSLHADLAMELENLADITLVVPDSIAFPNKPMLKKASAPFSDLSAYDYQMVKAVEDGLPVPEHINMDTASAHADWALYQKIKLKASHLVYPQKNKLLRKRLAFLPASLRVVAAAVLLLILFNVKEEMPEPFHADHSLAFTETDPVIEPSPIHTTEEPIGQEAPQSIYVTDQIARGANPSDTPKTSAETPEAVPSEVTAVTLPAPMEATLLPEPSLPNSYETGLRLMLPKYVENHQLMASLSNQNTPQMAEPDTKTLLSRTTKLIKQVSPFNLTYNKVYDEDGELVAINLSGENFEVAQRVPKWWNAK